MKLISNQQLVVQDIGTLHKCCIVDSRVPLKCGHDLPILSAACKIVVVSGLQRK